MINYSLTPAQAGTRVKLTGATDDVTVLVGDRTQTWAPNTVIEVVNATEHVVTFSPDDFPMQALTGAPASDITAGIVTLQRGEYGRVCMVGSNSLAWDLHIYQTDPLTNVDVKTTAPVTGNVLTFNGTNWVPEALPTTPVAAISTLTDVALNYLFPNQILVFDGSTWQNKNIIIKPAPYTVFTDSTTSFDFGSSAHHNWMYRSLSDADVTVQVKAESTFTGTDDYTSQDFQPANPAPMPRGGFAKFTAGGGGSITFVPDAGVTINAPDAQLVIDLLYGYATLIKVDTDVWTIEGRLTA